MAIVDVTVHPAIGVARLGNSPDDFFIGPERLWDPPDPAGGFKDGECRIKRQAARFRVYAHHDDGTVDELTAAEAEIEWTVHLANKKATNAGNSGASATDLTIDPGPRVLDGPDQRKVFDTGQISLPNAPTVTVPLGEVRTDSDGRLLVLGGHGNSASPTGQSAGFPHTAGWYDDISDGPVSAHLKLLATGDEYDATGAWVLVGPPKFAPELQSITTLYDRILQMAADQNWVAGPATPSYTDDVYPILQRARDIRWVYPAVSEGGGSNPHAWVDPIYDPPTRNSIFSNLANPSGGGGDMPKLQAEGGTLTKVQYAVMSSWNSGGFDQDWAGPPQPGDVNPAGLDRAALTNAVGAAFFPGIEAGGIGGTPIIEPGNYVGAADPMRLNQAVLSPGDMSQYMALPWQGDFFLCGYQWWPVPRPENVTRSGNPEQSWTAGAVGSMDEMVAKWNVLGFVVKQGSQYIEVERCDTSFIVLLTPHLAFQDVPQGPMGMSRKTALAVEFEVKSTGSAVTLQVNPGNGPTHARLTMPATSVTTGPTIGNQITIARLWVIYETGPIGESITDQLTVTDATTGDSWTVTISANTVGRKTAAAALVLDRSGSMSEDRGDGQSKHESVVEASSIMVDVMLEGDAIGVVAFNDTAQKLEDLTTLGPAGDPFDLGREATKSILGGPGLTPSGSTSIGAGILEGRSILNAATGFDVKSLVVLTDGMENTPPWIADVASAINELTYSVGLGTPENTSAAALQAISGNHGGYLLLTGAISGDNRFILQKYFLQILAGISNAEVVLDPQGELLPGHEQRIPFQVTEADAGMDVILLTPDPQFVDFRLLSPGGFIIDPSRAAAGPGMLYSRSAGNSFYRVVLPVELLAGRPDQAGTWNALLRIGKPSRPAPEAGVEGALTAGPRTSPSAEEQFMAAEATVARGRRTLPYSLVVHSYSNLSFRATVSQSSFDLGADATLHATLAESGIPPRPGAYVWAEVTRPDRAHATLPLVEDQPGAFSGSFTATSPGVYSCRVRATGTTRAGHPFTREQTLTVGVSHGGGGGGGGGSHEELCKLLRCLLGQLSPEAQQRLRGAGVDLAGVRRCLTEWCGKHDLG